MRPHDGAHNTAEQAEAAEPVSGATATGRTIQRSQPKEGG